MPVVNIHTSPSWGSSSSSAEEMCTLSLFVHYDVWVTQHVRKYISGKNHITAFGHVVVINDKSLVLSRWKSIDELQEMVHYAEKVYSAPFSNVFSWKLSLWRNNQFSWVGSLFLMIPSSVGQTWKYFLHWCLSISSNSFQPLVPCLINLFFNVS